MMKRSSLHQAACGLMLLFCASCPSWASTFQVNPVRVTLSADKPIAALTVRNIGADSTVIQLQVMSWSQVDGTNRYVPSSDILATPPIFTLPANGSQVIRVGFRQAPKVQGEHAYRLFLQEIPPPLKPDFKGLRVTLKISLPVFVQPAAAVAPQLHWQATSAGNGQVRIQVSNDGLAHAKLSRFELSMEGDPHSLSMPQQPVYVLPGASHDWLVDAPGSIGEHLHLTAQRASGDVVQADLVVSGDVANAGTP
jgi:fimbrial chaperone protein